MRSVLALIGFATLALSGSAAIAQETGNALSHAPDPALERPAASERVIPPMMPGMDMDDETLQHQIWIENLEGVYGVHNGGAWDAQGWLGGDFDKLWVKSEGDTLAGRTQDAKVEALWAHALLPFWDTQLGLRHDFSGGPSREWAAFGVQGIAPYWFDVELTGYLGEEGRTALRAKTEYDVYFTQRLVLTPEIELNAYGKPDQPRGIGAGLSDGEFELRLRYEFTRALAPYVGYVYDRKFAGTAALARAADAGNIVPGAQGSAAAPGVGSPGFGARAYEPVIDHRIVVGLNFFF